jgi:hypothetical protein
VDSLLKFWTFQTLFAKLCMFAIVILAVRSTPWFVDVALRLHRFARRPESERMSEELLATCALGAPFEKVSECFTVLQRSSRDGAIENPGVVVSAADIRFLQMWNECHIAIRKARLASFLAFGLSFASLIFGAIPTAQDFANGRLHTSTIIYLTIDQLLTALGVNLTLSFVMCYVTLYLDDVLRHRKECWTDLASRWRRMANL